MSKPGVTKGVKGLVAKGVILAIRNSSPERGDEPTTYRLHFRHETLVAPVAPEETTFTRGGNPRLHGGVNDVAPQETVLQETERQREFENSNDRSTMKIVDTLGITGYLDNLIVDISREFGDTSHLASNCKQARNIFAEIDLTEEVFVEQYVYAARQKTKHQTKVRAKMPYFFTILRESCGLIEAENV